MNTVRFLFDGNTVGPDATPLEVTDAFCSYKLSLPCVVSFDNS